MKLVRLELIALDCTKIKLDAIHGIRVLPIQLLYSRYGLSSAIMALFQGAE